MKKIILAIFMLGALSVSAQQTNTLLDQSFWRNNPTLESVKAEIQKGNSPTESNQMAMDVATMSINSNAPLDVIKFLLDQKGNDVTKLTHEGRTYLHWATMKGNTEVIKYLISKGADINLEDDHDLSPVYLGVNNGMNNVEALDAFFNAGLDPHHKYKEGSSLMMIAIPIDKDFKITEYLEKKGLSLNDTDDNGATVFDYAARVGDIDQMKALLKKGVKYTNNALLQAAQGTRRSANSVGVYKYLIDDLKLDSKVLTKDGNNLLQTIASKQNQVEVAEYLLSKGVDPNSFNNDGNNALMIAASGKDPEIVKLIISKEKDINAVNSKGGSALTAAIKGGASENAALLIQNKADVTILDAQGYNLAYYLIQFYRAPRGGFGGQSNAPQKDEFTEKLVLLKKSGLDITAPQKDGNTLYHYAASKGDLTILKKVSGLGIDINAVNEEGMTALHKTALTAKNDEILKFLIAQGAKKDIKTELDETAYDLAEANEYLKKNNVDISFLK